MSNSHRTFDWRTGWLMTLAIFWLALGCASKPREPETHSSTSIAITAEMIGSRHAPMKLSRVASDPAYGHSEKLPVQVGGGFDTGSAKTYSFLNGLRGPKGERVHYERVGSCCDFKTPNSPFDGEGLLEVYETWFEGAAAKSRLYFNWYDEGEILIPVGYSAAK